MEFAEDLSGTLALVSNLLRSMGAEHCFIGALPAMAWGRVRATSDLDVVVSCEREAWPGLLARLQENGFDLRSQVGPFDAGDPRPDIGFFWRRSPPIRVDVFIAKTPFETDVLRTGREIDLLGQAIRIATAEASIVYKLLSSRPKDVEDVQNIFDARSAAGTPLDWGFLEHWAEVWGISDRLGPYRAKYRR